MTMSGTTAIVGIGETDYLRGAEQSVPELILGASMRAISDAGLTPSDIDGVIPPPGFISTEEIARRINDELVATWGNLVNRVLAMTHKNCDAQVLAPGPLDDADQALLDGVDAAIAEAQVRPCHNPLINRAMPARKPIAKSAPPFAAVTS